MISWKKCGRVFVCEQKFDWSQTHAQTPVVDTAHDDFWRIYYSTRDANGKSSIGTIDVEPSRPKNILSVSKRPVLTKGEQGAFDDSGVMPTCIVNYGNKKYLYYIGWTQKVTVPYHNSIGLAVDDGDGFKKLPGPIVSTDLVDPYFQGTAFVKCNIGMTRIMWEMWYMSCVGWLKSEPIYHIRYATSSDGINWNRTGRVAIDLKGNEGGISSASVIQNMMWYSYRDKLDYRDNKKHSYKIGYAESNDGLEWERRDELVGIERSEHGWDSQMMCYPYVVKYNDTLYMFYNGNGFGKSGFGYAVST